MSFNSPSDNHETKHDPNHPAGTPQSQETGGNLQRVPADCSPCEALARAFPCPHSYIHPAYALGDWGTDVARLRAESYARACRSRAAVLCASTDAEDGTLGPAESALRKILDESIRKDVVAGLRPVEAFVAGQALYRHRYGTTEDPS